MDEDDPMTADEAREQWAREGVSETEAEALRSVVVLHRRVATLEAHREVAERQRDAALAACDALMVERDARIAEETENAMGVEVGW